MAVVVGLRRRSIGVVCSEISDLRPLLVPPLHIPASRTTRERSASLDSPHAMLSLSNHLVACTVSPFPGRGKAVVQTSRPPRLPYSKEAWTRQQS